MDSIRRQVYEWNAKFPVDLWWREKHGIPFGSKRHRNANFIDMLFEYVEYVMISEQLKGDDKPKYNAGHNDWIETTIVDDKQVSDWFDNIKI